MEHFNEMERHVRHPAILDMFESEINRHQWPPATKVVWWEATACGFGGTPLIRSRQQPAISSCSEHVLNQADARFTLDVKAEIKVSLDFSRTPQLAVGRG